MAADYNANLIVELYSAKNVQVASRICDEMVKIGDPIFPKQIYEAYKKYRGTSMSHYFVSDLTNFKSKDATEILKGIALTTENKADITMMVDYLASIKYFDTEIFTKVIGVFKSNLESGSISSYQIERYYEYLESSDEGRAVLESFLKMCFEGDNQEMQARKTSLSKLLKLKPKELINFYYENYDTIKGKKAEIIFVEEISTWDGGIVPALFQKILGEGSETAREILQKEQLKKDKEKRAIEINEQKSVREEYETADVLHDIAELRSKINKIGVTNERFGLPFFLPSEEIYQQSKPAKDKTTLVGYCMVLRSLLHGFDKMITELKIPKEKAVELIPNINDFDGSINKFHLLLLEKGVSVDQGIFGLRNINRIITKFAAHTGEENKSELIEILKEEKLLDLYKDDNWSMLHRGILLRYKMILEKLSNALAQNSL